jgi:cephalosporin hydroxylase
MDEIGLRKELDQWELKNAIKKFHIYYEENRLWEDAKWLGVPMWKLPFDIMIFQELIFKIRPSIIIETGTGKGGSALFYASIQKLMNIVDRNVITIDIEDKTNVNLTNYMDLNIVKLNGSSLNPNIHEIIDLYVLPELTTMVFLDSWHSYDHVLEEMEIYSEYVSKGSYMIVEDSHVNGHPIVWKWGKGPYEAIDEFRSRHDNFEIDKTCERNLITFNPNGYLRRIK